ncbi:Arc family DNA-binding protein [Glycomyces sp. NPDC048151]|uniref:Arc family DNA-binding protein n=1 Tax=Glycomyces sp. NPDC048151 TaxID=3364002 RepID=UPI003710C077
MNKLNLRLPEELRARLDTQAIADRRSLNSEIIYLLEAGLAAVGACVEPPDGDSTTHAPLRGGPNSPRSERSGHSGRK